jgi:hypothetical protein
MPTHRRIFISALATLAGAAMTLGTSLASAQTTPPDQAYVVASEVASDGRQLHTQVWIRLVPSALGCTGNQVFFLRNALVDMHGAQGVQAWNLQVQVAQAGASPTNTSFLFAATNVAIGAPAAPWISSQVFTMGSIGLPVSALVVNKPSFSANVSVVVWGYCGTPSNMGAVPVINL